MSVYILLLHGRDDPDQDMEDWGYTGPVLGPFDAVHVTYKEHLFCMVDGAERLELGFHQDMLVHDGRYYGDFEIASSELGIHRHDPDRDPDE